MDHDDKNDKNVPTSGLEPALCAFWARRLLPLDYVGKHLVSRARVELALNGLSDRCLYQLGYFHEIWRSRQDSNLTTPVGATE